MVQQDAHDGLGEHHQDQRAGDNDDERLAQSEAQSFAQAGEVLSGGNFPQAYRLIAAAGDEEPAVGRIIHSRQFTPRGGPDEHLLPGGDVPHAEETAPADLNTAPIVAVTPEETEVPVAEAIATTPPAAAAETTTPLVAQNTETLPKTASLVPLIGLLGLASLGCAFAVKRFAMERS